MKALKTFFAAVIALSLPLAAVAQAPAAAPAPEAPAFTFALHGFVSVSGGFQDGTFFPSEGQQSLSAGARLQTGGMNQDQRSLTADVRQSRFNFSVKGNKTVLDGATPTAVLEIDWMGGFGAGNYGDVSLTPRMRTAYTELNWGNNVLQLGQQNDLIFAMAPTSLSHIAFPLGYLTGNLGWRRPGVFGYHTFSMGDDMKLQAAWEIGRSQWADAAAAFGGGTVNPAGATASGFTLGEASGTPALEGRVTLTGGKLYTVWAAAHYSAIDLNGAGVDQPPTTNHGENLVTNSFHLGGKVTAAGLTVAATGYKGKNVSPLVGQFLDFRTAASTTGNMESMGWWVQAGYNITKEFSAWAFYGRSATKERNAIDAGDPKIANTTTNLIAMYREGGLGLSAEWIHFSTKYGTYAAGQLASTLTSNSNQYLLTGNFYF